MQQVAKNFREIFGELAPGGRGELVMQKQLRPDPQQEVDPEEDEEPGPSDRAGAMERYAGVKVKVGCCTSRTGHCTNLLFSTGLPAMARTFCTS